NAPRRARMSAAARKEPAAMETEVREKIHLEILKRTGAYHANDHILLPSGQHTSEYIEKTPVTTEPSFTEGLGAVIAKHFAPWPLDVVLATGPRALILSHCVARAHPSRPVVVYGAKGLSGGKRRVTIPVEFQRLVRPASKVLLIEDLVSTGSTLTLLINLVEQLGAEVVGVGCLATHVGRAHRQPGLQPREPRLPNLRSRGVSALQEGRAAQRGVRAAAARPPAVVGPRAEGSALDTPTGS